MTRTTPALAFLIAAALACAGEQRASADKDTLSDSAWALADESNGCRYLDRRWRCGVDSTKHVRVEMKFDTTDTTGSNPLIALEIFPLTPAIVRHTLPVGETMGAVSGSEMSMADLDGDGFGDLLLQLPYGHPNNTVQIIWRYQSAAKRFVFDSALSNETNVTADEKGCVRTSGYLGMSHQTDSRYCLEAGRWIQVARHVQRQDESTDTFMEYFYERRGDSLVLVKQHPMEP